MSVLEVTAPERKAADPGQARFRIPQLDVLRGIAILLVLGHHPAAAEESAGHLRALAEFWRRVGWSGVDLFFVLSGFLVGGLLLAEVKQRAHLDTGRFLIRRCFKIFPSYLVYLAFLTLYVLHAHDNPGRLWPNWLQVQDYFLSIRPHTWSLAVEEHFYLALPLALGLLIRRKQGRAELPGLIPLALALVAACTALRLLANPGTGFAAERQQYPTHLRLDSLFFGVLLAYLHQFRPEWLRGLRRHRWLIGAAAVVVVTAVAWFTYYAPWVRTFGFALLYLGYGALLLAAVPADTVPSKPRGLASRALCFIGVASYPIYLWHWEVMMALKHLHVPGRVPGSLAWLLVTGIYVAVAVGVGVVFGRLIEVPGLALRDRLFPAAAR